MYLMINYIKVFIIEEHKGNLKQGESIESIDWLENICLGLLKLFINGNETCFITTNALSAYAGIYIKILLQNNQ